MRAFGGGEAKGVVRCSRCRRLEGARRKRRGVGARSHDSQRAQGAVSRRGSGLILRIGRALRAHIVQAVCVGPTTLVGHHHVHDIDRARKAYRRPYPLGQREGHREDRGDAGDETKTVHGLQATFLSEGVQALCLYCLYCPCNSCNPVRSDRVPCRRANGAAQRGNARRLCARLGWATAEHTYPVGRLKVRYGLATEPGARTNVSNEDSRCALPASLDSEYQ